MIEKPPELDNGFQKENIKILKPEVNEAVITIPQASKSVVSLDKVPVEIEGLMPSGPGSPVETMEDISSFIEETSSEKGKG
ncbi:Putative LOC586785 [Caligus rogercresseyi]|uniref:LOC586785 n=1 Tax=Caligus rogercresseyi TaxID=217165 RepID=A0A7T8KDZ5_CALRO|nr:Putative LOC586785 [Caligus rogercresseyi]